VVLLYICSFSIDVSWECRCAACSSPTAQPSARIARPGDPCSYRLPHYQEDWSCVHDGLHSADSSDAINDVALGEGRDSNVSFSGEIQETYERFRNPNCNHRILIATYCNGVSSTPTFT
jgi:hypothetical protein